MGYINGNKVFQVVKTVELPKYKHHVKMQGEYGGINYTIYADMISNDNTNWATEGYTFSDTEFFSGGGYSAWEGVIAGYDDNNNKFQYAILGGSVVNGQSELYYDIENQRDATIDSQLLEFISDTVTQL